MPADWATALAPLRLVNLALSLLALGLTLSRARAAMQSFGRKRTARYWGYVLMIFTFATGNLESHLQGAPPGIRTILTTIVLGFVIYSEWRPGDIRPRKGNK